MNRLFYPPALLAIAALVAVTVLGLMLHERDIRNPSDRDTQRMATVHRLSGIAAGVLVLLVDSIVITYFVGTGRWCKEVSQTYALASTFVDRTFRLKRRSFPLAVGGMLIVVGMTALGGAADPASQLSVTPLHTLVGGQLTWADVHLAAALIGIAAIAFTFVRMGANLAENQQVIGEVMNEVRRIRTERGLD